MAAMANPPNRCPACGPVDPDLSSRYCDRHFQELRTSCRDERLEGCAGEPASQSARHPKQEALPRARSDVP